MDNQKTLSGYEIVAKGATKIEATLPELGLKDIFPNRSWLEDKQIQAAIEARKHLIEVERINKSGVLSHAEWREELMLAEVTQKAGSYWQYLGHNVGKTLFLKPEEALFLLETNNLSLKYNNVKVSLQQAYTLLLRDKITLLQYKVYASLSRLGYRVYRHYAAKPSTCVGEINLASKQAENDIENAKREKTEEHYHENCTELNENIETLQQCSTKMKNTVINEDVTKNMQENITEIDNCENKKSDLSINTSASKNKRKHYQEDNMPSCSYQYQSKQRKLCRLKKLQKLKNRQLKPCNVEIMHNYFNNMPELLEKTTVVIKTPDKQLLPNTINLTKSAYKLNLHDIQKKIIRPSSTESNIYSVSDEVNGSHIRRLRNTSNRTESNWWVPPTPNLYTNQNPHFRPFNFWRRPPFMSSYYNVNMLFQRPFLPGWFFTPNFNFYPRPQPPLWRYNYNSNRNNPSNSRKRTSKTAQKHQFDGILKLASRLKQLILNGNTQQQNIYSLQRLIQTYNTRYRTKIRLNESFDIVDETIVDTIELDDDEGPSTKRSRTTDNVFEENLNNLKLFASRLKELEFDDKSSGRHRRGFSKLLKTFNKSYNEDYYLNDNYEVACRNQIDLDTSGSDLDCIIEETPATGGKKLKNPFNILKRLSETQKHPPDNVSRNKNDNLATNNKYSEITLTTFTRNWLPKENDFGRAEIISKDDGNNETIDVRREEFLYDFIKTCEYNNWFDLKKSFFNSIQAAIVEFQDSIPSTRKRVNSIVKPEDCTNMASVLKKLSIIKSENKISDKCNLSIDFDVYSRDVQNFRKSNRPTPHFRVICMDESTNMPPGDEIAVLHSKNTDQVTIVFAIVGIDSISYVQINPTVLPVYMSNNT